ncbi:PREDICTED: ras-interacting protein 1 [Mandrillus leucophaeus]|uniref:ras-interacting protein 1 n=1 Tax=Mandrillus leucophaeus TaxID=9568 RepID=UPI0005F5392B|nr:PREDICTED: ras-interacting protein 1 [Mandrillus leucophaeus]
MLSGERKEGGSPRFGKLHLPVGLWINSPRKQLAKLGRRWPSAASVKSSSSDTGSRSSEPLPPPPPHVELRRVGAVKAAGGASGSRAKRISQLFRGSGHSARELELGHLPRLLGRLARLIKEAVWEKIKEIGDRQPENHPEGVPEVPLTPEAVSVELRPLMLWMANTTELLSFVQEKVLEMEKEADQEDPQLCNDLELCDEAMALLDEVIMCTFQQSVYYLTKTLYSTLPALLDSNPFTAGAELPGPGAELEAMPPGLRPTLGVFQAALELTSQCELHPDLVSQTFGYLFFFSNASLLNSLMERGQGRPFYQWSRAVQIRTNLDLVLDWLQGAGLGDIATEFFRKLSMAVNLLCVPRTSLLKASWSSLRMDHPTLTPAQLHHLLSHYQLGPGLQPPAAWDPPPAEREAVDTGDIFESFSSHPPLILPLGSSRLRLTGPVTNDALHRELRRLRRLLWDLEQQELPANYRHGPPVAASP